MLNYNPRTGRPELYLEGGSLDGGGVFALAALGGLLVGGDAGAGMAGAQKISPDDLFLEDLSAGTIETGAEVGIMPLTMYILSMTLCFLTPRGGSRGGS